MRCRAVALLIPSKNRLHIGHQYAGVRRGGHEVPDWVTIYFIKNEMDDMKCNLCDVILKVDEKSMELLDHIRDSHRDVHDLHKENPEATVGFRIEFLHLNVLKDDGDPKTQPVMLGEVCEASTEPAIIEKNVSTLDISNDETVSESNTQYVVIHDTKKPPKKDSTDSRKRSWVWKYFDKLSNIIYRCNMCNVVLSIKACNSNNMNRHIRTRHPDVYKLEVLKRDKNDHSQFVEVETPYAIKTEEIYASDKDVEDTIESSRRLRRSWVWSYFLRISPTAAECKLCHRHICHGGNATGNLNRHLKMIHHKSAYDTSWVWKVFDNTIDDSYYCCKICQYKCKRHSDIDQSMANILVHLKMEHGVVSGEQIITGTDI